jgi:hypothetical protein
MENPHKPYPRLTLGYPEEGACPGVALMIGRYCRDLVNYLGMNLSRSSPLLDCKLATLHVVFIVL